MTCALHKTLVENTSIIYSVTGKFLETSSFFINDIKEENLNNIMNNPNNQNLNNGK